ncbi:phosphoribosylglycinamide formyltransferase [Sediminibacillus dalangtanensis]|uniref:Phosphoribosylglycinamide formyltransferase n=1 Tax=Sediminibacillus dalangtanensis TaxID=2729421 RepID=A0ABX7VRL8_9BACI|nr:phosphoribosylglycinamide formyltransferase [Sediminibacillus dalangtanensis]QTM98210.1 phosphoribosylglycinamide formyltransferase [Sediminibacillus dalangtanensis]
MHEKQRLAVFASGTGSNFVAIADAIDQGRLDAEIVLLVCDNSEAKVIGKARDRQIPVFVFQAKNYPSKVDYERDILQELNHCQAEWLILAGYMRLVGDTLLDPFEGRIVNIHPSLLPAFPGKDAIGQALSAGVKVTGVTVHFVDEGMDTGTIIDQEVIRIQPEDDQDTLQANIQEIEHRLFPKTIQALIQTEKREEIKS